MANFRIVEMEGGTHSLDVLVKGGWMLFYEDTPFHVDLMLKRLSKFTSVVLCNDSGEKRLVSIHEGLSKASNKRSTRRLPLASQRLFSFPDWKW